MFIDFSHQSSQIHLPVSCLKPAFHRSLREFLELIRVGALKEAIRISSSGDVARIAHKLVGSSLSCGVDAFTQPLRELERLGQEGDLSGADALFDEVRRKFPRVQSALAQLMPNPPELQVTIP